MASERKETSMTEGFLRSIKTSVLRSIILVAVFLSLSAMPGLADSTVDQSFTTGGNPLIFINGCCAFVGQTYTAGLNGTLAGVSIDVVDLPGYNFPLNVQIRTVAGGLPTTNILGQTTVNAFTLTDLIAFPQTIPQIAGNEYAIVVDFVGGPAQGLVDQAYWQGGMCSACPGSTVFSSDGGVDWTPSFPDTSAHLITYVNSAVPEPGSALLLILGAVISGIYLRRRT
jgi:PEP-CTERM motif